MQSEKQRQINEAIGPTIETMGFEYVGCEVLAQGRFSVLRIFVDKDGGISADECGEVSHQISGILDVEDFITTRYNLEVSSPGLDRPLFTLAQYMKALGQEVKVRLSAPMAGQRNFQGELKAVVDENIVLLIDEKEVTVPFAAVAKANTIYQF
jgi:ribosome maturation factor RimP